MARRELYAGRKRLVLYTVAITVGVAALVSINSFRQNIVSSIHGQARGILGADLALRHRNAFPDTVEALIASLKSGGLDASRVVSFGSMVLGSSSDRAPRLLQVRAIEGSYPYYGTVTTEPAEAWGSFQNSHSAVVEEAAMLYLDARVGDSISIGDATFRIVGILKEFPGNLGIRSAIGPRVFIPLRYLEETGLIRFGSIAQFRSYIKFPSYQSIELFLGEYDELFDAHRVTYDTVADVETDLSSVLDRLSRFLGLIGLVALLLGGIAIGSAVHVFVKEKLDTMAVLRCIGATQKTVFGTYLLVAAALGLAGATAGTVLGVAIQATLPRVLGDFLPLDVAISIDWWTVATGLVVGTLVALVFALLPLLKIRDVSPLRALRRDFVRSRTGFDWLRWAVAATLVATVVVLSLWQAPTTGVGLAFAGAVGVTTGLLAVIAWATVRSARKFFPRRASYVIRQGVANLFRPQNQTVSVVLGIGFGVFLIATLHLTQRSLLDQLSVESSPDKTNLVMFDIQSDQHTELEAILDRRGHSNLGMIPIVPSRIARVNDRSVEDILADSALGRGNRWMYRREYRNTYRAELNSSEVITAGGWWDELGIGSLPRISLDEDIALGLEIGLGDHITWDIQGVEVETQIASLRRINWARFEPNFFAIFEPGVLDEAPQTYILMTRVDDIAERVELQRDVVGRFSNISVLDLTEIQRTIDGVVNKVAVAIRFMALFSITSGLIVLIGAITTTKYQRIHESALLKTLGASTRQVRQILVTEYFALGTVASFSGMLLATAAGWGLSKFMFNVEFNLSAASLLAYWMIVTGLTVMVGLVNSRSVTRHTPLATLRELSE